VFVFVRFLKLSEEEQILLQQNKLREFKGKPQWDGNLEELRTTRTLPPASL
jgi:hypothetical protein